MSTHWLAKEIMGEKKFWLWSPAPLNRSWVNHDASWIILPTFGQMVCVKIGNI